MQNAGITQRRAIVRKAGFTIKFARVRLRVQVRANEAAAPGFGHECREQRAPGTHVAGLGEHGHPADAYGPHVRDIITAGADEAGFRAHERVHGRRVGPVVRVDLFIGRNALFVHEHGGTDRKCGC